MVQRLGSQARTAVFQVVPAILMAAITVILVADVFGRYVLNSPIHWAPEMALFAFVWLVYLGAVDVSLRRSHIAVDVLTDLLPTRLRAAVAALVQLLSIAVLSYLAWYGIKYFLDGRFTSLPVLGISKRFMELAIPVSAIGMAVVALVDLRLAIRGVVTGVFSDYETSDVTDDGAADRAFANEVAKVMDPS